MVFDTVIHNNVRLCEAPSAGESVLLYAPRSRGALEYRALAAEILGDSRIIEPAGGGSREGAFKKTCPRCSTACAPPARSARSPGTEPEASEGPTRRRRQKKCC